MHFNSLKENIKRKHYHIITYFTNDTKSNLIFSEISFQNSNDSYISEQIGIFILFNCLSQIRTSYEFQNFFKISSCDANLGFDTLFRAEIPLLVSNNCAILEIKIKQ